MKLFWQKYNLELKHTFSISSCSRDYTPVVIVKLVYEDFCGFGEASLPPYLGETQSSVIDFLRKVDFSQFMNPFEIDEILDYVNSLEDGNTAAKASIDIALHDLTGKILGKPLFDIWGLNKDDTPYTSFTIGIDRPEIIKEKVKEVDSDFRLLKIKLDGKNDRQIINAVRSVTELPLAVDVNQAWTDKNKALDDISWLAEQKVILIEQPFNKDNLDDHAWLTERSPLPVFADESVQRFNDLYHIKGAFSGINVKLMKCTGLREGKKMFEVAPLLGFEKMIGCMTETSCAISAAAHLSPLADIADLDGALLIKNDCFKGIGISKGKITLNNTAGTGTIPDFPAEFFF